MAFLLPSAGFVLAKIVISSETARADTKILSMPPPAADGKKAAPHTSRVEKRSGVVSGKGGGVLQTPPPMAGVVCCSVTLRPSTWREIRVSRRQHNTKRADKAPVFRTRSPTLANGHGLPKRVNSPHHMGGKFALVHNPPCPTRRKHLLLTTRGGTWVTVSSHDKFRI